VATLARLRKTIRSLAAGQTVQAKENQQIVVSLGNVMANSVRVSVSPFAVKTRWNPEPASGFAERFQKTRLRSGPETETAMRVYLLSTHWNRTQYKVCASS